MGIRCGLSLRKAHRLRAFENRVLRKIFGPKRDEITAEWRRLRDELRVVCFTFLMAQQPLVGQGLLIVEGLQLQSYAARSVGLLWTSDQPDTETSTWQHNAHKRQKSMPSARFEPAIPASERLQTHALDRASTRTGCNLFCSPDIVTVMW